MLTIKVEATPGAGIEDTFKEATELAEKLNCFVDFNFNGVHCAASPGGDPKTGVEGYYKAICSKNTYKFTMS